MTLREQLIGAWRLVSFIAELRDGRVISPMGRAAEGLIVYSDSGVVSVNLSTGRRTASETGRLFAQRSDAAVAEVARGYMAYAGAFEVDEERAVARHHFEMCLDPALIETLQERHINLSGDTLELSVPARTIEEGGTVPSSLVWRRW